MQEKIKILKEDAKRKISEAKGNVSLLNDLRIKFLGKSGEITALLKSLKDVPAAERPSVGKFINELRSEVEAMIQQSAFEAERREMLKRIGDEKLDVTLSKRLAETGALHPLSVVKDEIIDAFIGLGFEIKDGPEIEKDYYNFQALNLPEDHPARDTQDTFYITNEFMLRSQTSAVQVHAMEEEQPPFRILCPGKVYRSDDDASHSPMFQQIEGLVIDKHVTLCDLQGVLDAWAKAFFSPETKTRLRPSFFPFTEPSVEVDLSCSMCGGKGCRLCKGTGWIEILGAGVVNPAVLEMSGIDPEEYSGIAFGMGVERAAMIKYGIPDMRILFENDLRFLKLYK